MQRCGRSGGGRGRIRSGRLGPVSIFLERPNPSWGVLGDDCRFVVNRGVVIGLATDKDEVDGAEQFVRESDDRLLVATADRQAGIFGSNAVLVRRAAFAASHKR